MENSKGSTLAEMNINAYEKDKSIGSGDHQHLIDLRARASRHPISEHRANSALNPDPRMPQCRGVRRIGYALTRCRCDRLRA